MKQILKPHPCISSFLAREVHCGSTILSAVRQCLVGGLFKNGRKGFFATHDRNHRRWAIAGIMFQHSCNKVEYMNVMKGTCSPWRSVKNPFRFDTETNETTIKS